ncbi:MAG TPA: TIGR03620 family F420-dependent LLM class oxidoreductase [Solirubrobacteraceae bacterium]|nr:TIGR03620 family F420-dependent LLM class oxidoreductase [Solirubrobacteraceae bacterium]
MELGLYGIWTSFHAIGEENAPAAAKVAQDLGYGTFWVGGSPRLASLRPALEVTDSITVGTSIVNVWQYEPAELCAEFHALEADFPGRVIVGIGIGHPEATSEYEKPLTKMTGFLDGIAASPAPIPAERMIIAALGPRMLDLSGARSLGTIPYFTPPEHTGAARERLALPALVAPELAMVLDEDRPRAAATARRYAELYLGLANYTTNLKRFGFSDTDIAAGGSDRLMNTIVPQGSAAALAEHVAAHRAAGADHVCIQTLGGPGVPEADWAAMASALGLRRG